MNLADMNGAIVSACGAYRYRLWRYWQPEDPPMCFIMLNPSTADANEDDATIRRCMGFARLHNAGGIEIANLFAWRSTNPEALRYLDGKATDDIIGPDNDEAIMTAVNVTLEREGKVVLAWGANAKYHKEREKAVLNMLLVNCMVRAHALAVTANGHPKHPLYCSYIKPLQEFAL